MAFIGGDVSSELPVLAIDVGGTTMAAALVDAGGRVVASSRVPTPHGRHTDADTVWRTLAGLVRNVVGEPKGGAARSVSGVGVGCGGPMKWPVGSVSPLNLPAWRDFPLRERLRELFPGVPVRVHNCAVCVVVAEHWRGAGQGVGNVLGMVVSTGVGGGLVLGGRLVDGASGNAGHIGHVVVDPAGPVCACGGRGCLEAIASGPRLALWAREQGWVSSTGNSARELADDARRGHPVALQALQRAGRALGTAIASAMYLCDLQVVSIGGGLSQAGPLLFAPLEESLRRHTRMRFTEGLRVVPASLGMDAGLVGAAGLLLAGERYWNGD